MLIVIYYSMYMYIICVMLTLYIHNSQFYVDQNMKYIKRKSPKEYYSFKI